MAVELALSRDMFARFPQLLAKTAGFTIYSFRYPSGVEALRISNEVGEVVVLPFKGQQIWDARFGGRQLTMKSLFDEPVATQDYLKTYGAFFVHCGATATGVPGPDDDHPIHGELPNIAFESAALEFDTDDVGAKVTLTGVARDRVAMSHSFAFRPRLTLREGSSVLDMSVEVENIGSTHMPLMYLAHINFRPVAGARLVDALPQDSALTWEVPSYLTGASPELRRWHEEVAADFERHRSIKADDRVEKEFGFGAAYPAGMDGQAAAMQLLPDGSADFVRFRPDELARASRWMTRASERQALGFCMPSTTRPLGRRAAEKAGNLRWLDPGEVFKARFSFGALDAEKAGELATEIAATAK